MLQGIDVEPNKLKQTTSCQLPIIYNDNWIVAVNKPSGLLSVPGKESTDSVISRLSTMMPDTKLLAVHRLDMSTSGVLLVAKDERIYKALQRQFSSHTVSKRYVALLSGNLAASEGEIKLPLRADTTDRPRQMVDFEHGRQAITHFKVVGKSGNGYTRVVFYPTTGRTHQLRVHAAHKLGLGCPIVGDNLYGQVADRLYLHSEYLQFTHPITGQIVAIEQKCDF